MNELGKRRQKELPTWSELLSSRTLGVNLIILVSAPPPLQRDALSSSPGCHLPALFDLVQLSSPPVMTESDCARRATAHTTEHGLRRMILASKKFRDIFRFFVAQPPSVLSRIQGRGLLGSSSQTQVYRSIDRYPHVRKASDMLSSSLDEQTS